MTPATFKAWRERAKMSQRAAATALGVSTGTISLWERETRADTGKPVKIPKTVALACAALSFGIPEMP